MGFCESFSKICLIILNILFFIIGGVILGLGIWIKVDRNNFFGLLENLKFQDEASSIKNSSISTLNILAIFLIVLGAYTFLTGFCGCCGAMRESKCLLYFYALLVLLVVLVEIALGIYGGVQKSKIQDDLSTGLLKGLQRDFNGAFNKDSNQFTRVLTALMFNLKCCGAYGENDFKNTTHQWKIPSQDGKPQFHPVGCCELKSSYAYDTGKTLSFNEIKGKLRDSDCPYNQKTYLNQKGCGQSIIDFVKSHLGIVIGVCVGLGLFEIICIVFACCVARKDD